MKRKSGVLLFVLALSLLMVLPHATSAANLCIWGAAHCRTTGAVMLDLVSAVTDAGIEAAGIALAVSPWLAMGAGLCFVG